MGLRALFCLLLTAGSVIQAQSVTRLDDPLRDPTRLRNWDRLEGLDLKPNSANAFIRNDVTVIAGALRTAFRQPGADALNFEASVRIFIPAQSIDGSSVALFIAGPGGESRATVSVITDQAGMDKEMCAVGILGERMECTPLKRNAWHILRIRVDEGVAEVSFSPEDGDTFKVSDIDISSLTPNFVSHLGLSTTGTAMAFRQLSAVAVQIPTSLPTILQAEGVRAEINRRGRLTALHLKRGKDFDTFRFRSDKSSGPTWLIEQGGRTYSPLLQPHEKILGLYQGKLGDVSCALQYRVDKGRLEVEATLENLGEVAFQPLSAALRLGLDTEQLNYPQWHKVPTPTFLRCEPTHAWGYAMTPHGEILGLACPDAAANWQHVSRKPGGERPSTFSLTLLGQGEYTEAEPTLQFLKPAEKRTWRLRLFSIADLSQVPSRLSSEAGACFPYLALNTLEVGQPAILPRFVRPGELRTAKVIGVDKKSYEIYPQNRRETLEDEDLKRGFSLNGIETPDSLRFMPENQSGTYRLRIEHTEIAKDKQGEIIVSRDGRDQVEALRISETVFLVRQPWSVFKPPSSNVAPLDLRSASSATPQVILQAAAAHAQRRTTGADISELEFASALVDLALSRQPTLASSDLGWFDVMKVMQAELREVDQPAWRVRFDRHHAATQKAMSELVARLDNLPSQGSTEFNPTRLCQAAALLGQWCGNFVNPPDRIRYQQSALELLRLTRCAFPVFSTPEITEGTVARSRALFLLYQQTGTELLLCEALQNLGATEPKGALAYAWLECVQAFVQTQGYVVVRADGSYWGYNCQVNRKDGILEVKPAEACVTEIHALSRWPNSKVRVHFAGHAAETQTINGMVRIKAEK